MEIVHDLKEFEVGNWDKKKGFKFKSKNKEVEFEIYDDKIIKEVIDKKFNYQYKKILMVVMDVLNSEDEDSASDIEIALEMIDTYINKIIDKYKNYLDEKTLNKYLKMLNMSRNELIQKLDTLVVTKGKGR